MKQKLQYLKHAWSLIRQNFKGKWDIAINLY